MDGGPKTVEIMKKGLLFFVAVNDVKSVGSRQIHGRWSIKQTMQAKQGKEERQLTKSELDKLHKRSELMEN